MSGDKPADGLAALFARVKEAGQAAGRVMGMPDYERYLAHVAERHPDQPALTRKLFVEQAIDRRYGGLGPRCC